MAFLFYTLSFLFLLTATVLFITRTRWRDRLPPLPVSYIYSRLPASFASDIESGFTSTDFDLSSNMMEGDSRAGLDEQGKREVQKIMRQKKVGFDEGRRMYMEKRFKKNNIGADGLPRDPKFVSFS